jgi:CheY-like chemotaxis protein/anti-sigma regulatory factor (Ser/Thr protein kinase)
MNAMAPGVLVIDDEPMNIRLLKTDLEGEGYRVLSAKDGEEGLAVLAEHIDEVALVMLDRMMPVMDGMAFLAHVRHDPRYTDIPVIMVSAAAQKEEIVEGLQAGVHYYLTKPYDYDIMLSLVRSAVEDMQRRRQLQNALNNYKSKLRIIRECHFEIQTLDEAQHLTTFLAQFYPEPERVVVGLAELLINAVEHGNLEITYDEKTRLVKENRWQEEVTRRLQLPAFACRLVQVGYYRSDSAIRLRIQDEGPGFDWQKYLRFSPERASDNHGRGVALAAGISFDELRYQGLGNVVEAVIRIR